MGGWLCPFLRSTSILKFTVSLGFVLGLEGAMCLKFVSWLGQPKTSPIGETTHMLIMPPTPLLCLCLCFSQVPLMQHVPRVLLLMRAFMDVVLTLRHGLVALQALATVPENRVRDLLPGCTVCIACG